MWSDYPVQTKFWHLKGSGWKLLMHAMLLRGRETSTGLGEQFVDWWIEKIDWI